MYTIAPMICEGIRDIECLALAVAEAEGILVAITWCIVSITHCTCSTACETIDYVYPLSANVVEALYIDTAAEVV